MNAATLIRFTLLASMMLLVFALGLRSTAGDAGYVLRRPGLLLRSLLAMNVVLPLLVLWLVLRLDLRPAVAIALVALSVSPVPPFLPSKLLKLTEREGYIYGLLVASALCSVVLVPLATALLESLVDNNGMPVRAVAVLRIVALTVLVPLGIGMSVRRFWRGDTERMAGIANKVGTVLLVLAFIPVLIAEWPALRSLLGDGTLVAIIVVTAVGLLVGHLLGGRDQRDRTVLALATSSRHPAVALAVAAAVFPDQKLAPAAVLLALVVGVLAGMPYTAWRKNVHRKTSGEAIGADVPHRRWS